MKRKDRPPTMKDVAREAGVALGTVSKVFNDIPVGEDYRARVEAAAARLGYRVNSYARGLKTYQSRMVALLLPDIVAPLYAALAEEVCKALARRDYRMILALSHSDPEEERRSVRLLEQHNVDGVIGVTCAPAPDSGDRTPFVRIDGLDAGEHSVEAMPGLAEQCVKLLFESGRENPPKRIRIDGVTLTSGPRPS